MKDDNNTLSAKRFFEEITNRGELATIREIMTDDFSFVTPASTHYSRADFEIYMGNLHEAWQGFHVTVHDLKADQDTITANVDFAATPVKEFLGIPPNFKKFQLPAVCRFKIQNEKIKSLNIEYDFAQLLKRD